ncbi:hypothetical protein BDF22DRAFT_742793 [Syncephalis plumigaleata]|nr:hypothetical protein BDF22DRAFT_742793 [Syncephalis plumigaleata]
MEQSSSIVQASPVVQNDTNVEETAVEQQQQQQQQQNKRSRMSIHPLVKTPSFVLQHLLNWRTILLFVFIGIIIYIYTWLYVGCVWNPVGHINNVKVALLNSDQGFNFTGTPNALQAMILQSTGGHPLGDLLAEKLVTVPEANFDWQRQTADTVTRDALVQAVDDGDFTAAIIIPSTFSQDFLSAFPVPGSSPNRRQMQIEYVHDQGRNYGSDSIISTIMLRLLTGVSNAFELRLLSSPNATAIVTAAVPTFWASPIQTANTVLHPVYRYGQNFASYASVVVMIIGCIGVVTIVNRYLDLTPVTCLPHSISAAALSNTPRFSVARIVVTRLAIMLSGLFVYSLLVWSVPLSLDQSQFDGAPSVAALFYIFFIGASILGIISLLCDAMGVDNFAGAGSSILIIFLTTSSAIIADELSNGFFHLGRAFPFYYAVRGLRFIYFGSSSKHMWINCVVLGAWMLVTLTATSFVTADALSSNANLFSQCPTHPNGTLLDILSYYNSDYN